jgi:hypothetical protein
MLKLQDRRTFTLVRLALSVDTLSIQVTGDVHVAGYGEWIKQQAHDDTSLLCLKKTEEEGETFAALLIGQKKRRNERSGILLPALYTALERLAILARFLNGTETWFLLSILNQGTASVHVPRMGSGDDWYQIERALRTTLVVHNVPTYVYVSSELREHCLLTSE